MVDKEVLARVFQRCDWDELPVGALFFQDPQASKHGTWMKSRWILIRDGETSEYAIGPRVYHGAGLKALLLDTSLESIDLYRSLDGRPGNTDARCLVAVATKAST
jgi:hypothetical protein